MPNEAEKIQTLESAFILHWIILEHLFLIHNISWLSKDQMRKISSVEKLSFLLVEYDLKSNVSKQYKKEISKLTKVRNKLLHFGKFANNRAKKNAELIIELTEFITAKTLGLFPSVVFNTPEKLEEFLSKKGEEGKRETDLIV